MKNHLHVCNSSDDEKIIITNESSSGSTIERSCWWRSAAGYDEYVKLKHEGGLPDVSKVTPNMIVFMELERLALLASGTSDHCGEDGVNELRHKLLTYRSGDFWIPIGGVSKEKMDIPPVATILLVGFSGSGKSSLVNLMYSVFGRSGLIPFAQTTSCSASGRTKLLKEHNVMRSLRSGFCVYDSRGFDYNEIGEGIARKELSCWTSYGIHHNQGCLTSEDSDIVSIPHHSADYDNMHVDFSTMFEYNRSSKFVKRRVNCVIVVANMTEIYKALKAGDSNLIEATRQLFCLSAFQNCSFNDFAYIVDSEKPIMILTHGDMLSTEERIECRLKICESLGVSEMTGVYDIVCLTEYGFLAEESDPISAYALTEAVYRALLISDMTHLPKKTHQDWALFVLSSIVYFIAFFFALIADICFKLGGGERRHALRNHQRAGYEAGP